MNINKLSKRIISRVTVFLSSLLGCLLVTMCGAQEKTPEKYNFLVIMADDVSPQHYGCYGNKNAATPNIDSLAKTGVVFQTCWAAPICSPTRAMMLTGRYANRTGWYHNALRVPDKNGIDDFRKNNYTFARLLKEQGYVTALAGKWQLPGLPDDPESGFGEYCIWEPGENNLPEGSDFRGLKENENTLSRYWFPSLIKNGSLVQTGPEDFGPDICVDFLIDFMERNKSVPFLAYYPMILPHGTRGGRTTTPLTGRTGDLVNGTMRENVDYTDVLVGRLIKALDELDLRGNTLVIFTGDNAMPDKNCATNDGSRVPMVINLPGIVKKRDLSGELVSLSDILPTLVDLSGGKLPDEYTVDGISLVPFLKGETETHRDYLFNYLGTARIVRDKEWILEAVDEVYRNPEGRLYHCPDGGSGCSLVSGRESPEARQAMNKFNEILAKYPPLDTSNTVVKRILPVYDKYTFRHRLE